MREVKGENVDYDYKMFWDVILKGIVLGYLYLYLLDGWG